MLDNQKKTSNPRHINLKISNSKELEDLKIHLEEKLSNIEFQGKVINESAQWWSEKMNSLLKRMDDLEDCGDVEDYDALVKETEYMNKEGTREMAIMADFQKLIDSYFREKAIYVEAYERLGGDEKKK